MGHPMVSKPLPTAIAHPHDGCLPGAVSADQFKQAMRHLGGTANVITVAHQGRRGGLTATSVTSVSAEPPEILVCINQSASSWPLLRDSGLFGVNILSAAQMGLAQQFAGLQGEQGEQRYAGHEWMCTEHGIWLARLAPAALACQVVEIVLRHSHAIVLGKVLQVHLPQPLEDSPLLYWQGRFGRFQA